MQFARKLRPVDLMAFAYALQKRHEAATTVGCPERKRTGFHAGRRLQIHGGIVHADSRPRAASRCGGGIGSLAAAVCERMLTMPSPHRLEIMLYESDAALLPLLEENMRHCREALDVGRARAAFTIQQRGFHSGDAEGGERSGCCSMTAMRRKNLMPSS